MNLAHFRHVIFDMDGVIINSEPLQVEAEKFACASFGISVPDHEWETFKGKTNRAIFTHIVTQYARHPVLVDELIETKRTFVKQHLASHVPLIEGSIAFLTWLRTQPSTHIALATSTGSEIQTRVFDQFNLHRFFQVIVTGDDVRFGKPHPDPYLLATQRLCVSPQICVVIEDSDNGIISAKAAGCIAVGITTTFPREKLVGAGADVIVDSFAQLQQLFSQQLS